MEPHQPQILFVDDEPQLLEGLATGLRRRFRVATATSGASGLEVLREQGPFAVVVADFLMPRMNGAEFLARVRHVAPDTVRMLLTGHATLDGAMAAINEGHVFRFLTKPCPPDVLARALDDALEQARLVTGDRTLLEQKLDAMAASLVRAERLASLGTMAGAVGHELNNVLTVFVATVEALGIDAARGAPPSPAAIGRLEKVAAHLTKHARSLLSLGRPGGGVTGTTDLIETLKGVLDMLRLGGLTKTVRVGLDLPAGAVPVVLSTPALEQVFVNLIKNAVEAFGDDRGDRRVDIRVDDAGAGAVVCAIEDNAGGIPPEALPLLFEPYFTTKPPDRGTGLGLFVVRDVLRAVGGDVTVASTPGMGTTFTLRLPRPAAGAGA